MVKPEGAPKFERVPLVATARRDDVRGHALRRQEADRVLRRSRRRALANYKMKVVELPAVAKLELEYVFPAYTGLPPQKVESGGDVAALRGTEVRVKITPTMASPAGQLQLDPGTPSGLTAQADGTLTGSFKMDKDGFYHVELDGPHGEKVDGVAEVHGRRDRRPAADGDVREAEARHERESGRRSVRAGARRRRLRREAAGSDLLGERRRREDRVALRQGRQAAAAGERRPHGVSRRARREARRLRVVLREGVRHGHGARARRARRATSTSSRSCRSTRTSARRSRRAAAVVAAAGGSESGRARSRSRSGRSSPRRSTSSAIKREDAGRQVQGRHRLHQPVAVEAARAGERARPADAAAAGQRRRTSARSPRPAEGRR